VARRERLGFLPPAALPDRADRVDHVPGRQPVAGGRLRLARTAAAEPTALLEQLGTGGAVNRAVDAAAAEQRAVGSVDDRVDILLCDVSERRLDHEAVGLLL